MTLEEQRKQKEQQIMDSFSELQSNLENLRLEIESEQDDAKQEKNNEILILEYELYEIKNLLDIIADLKDEELESLKTKLESIKKSCQEFRWEISNLAQEVKESSIRTPTPTTYELLKDSVTCNKLVDIISSNPKEFENIPWATPEAKLEHIFSKTREIVVRFLKNKLWNSEKYNKVIDNTIAPALERNIMEFLHENWNNENINMLEWIGKISWNSLIELTNWVIWFSDKFKSSYNRFNQWINAIDYLSVHNGVLLNPEKSAVLTNPIEFRNYLNNPVFNPKDSGGNSISFSPYTKIDENIFKVDENQNFEFWMSSQEKQAILAEIWNIQVANNPKTTELIAKMLDKSEKFLWTTVWLQKTANGILDWVNFINSFTKKFWVDIDILWEISKAPEDRNFIYKMIDFVCKLIWITWWLEWMVKRWRLDRMDLTDQKNEDIGKIFENYKELAWENISLSIMDENSCKTALNYFSVTDMQNKSSTKWDFLRDSIAEKMDVSLISPSVLQQAVEQHKLWKSLEHYLKKETVKENWRTKEKKVIDKTKFTEDDKLALANNHLVNMKDHLEKYNDNNLSDFYTNIHSTQDLALCITASLYVNKDDVIEWVKAKVFLPENYGSVHSDGTVDNAWNNWWRENLDSSETFDKQIVTEQRVFDKAVEYWIKDKAQIAYILSTVKWECWFKNQVEIWKWKWKRYWEIDRSTWHAYYGRWFIQLTWKKNYQKYTDIIRDMWKDFRDNDGNIIRASEIDLVDNPDLVLKSNELAIFITIYWMKNWIFTWKKLDDFINWTKTDFYHARSIVNWMTSRPQEFANNAKTYLAKLWDWEIDTSRERDDLLIWPKLLAQNENEIWWLGNSIMVWFQWYKNKLNFPNMDGEEWKSTQTHPRRFKSQLDVQWYKAEHPNIKSFMFYFWANTSNNKQTLEDITKRSEWLQEEWIQPVLCTCIWEDRHTWLTSLNEDLRNLWKKKTWPVFDFARQYNKWDIAMWWGTSSHPTSDGYSSMAWLISEQFQA